MGRADYVWTTVRGIGGINQQVDLADPAMELLDARNVWAPDGRVVQRPGYVGVATRPVLSIDALTGPAIIKETPIGTFTTTGVIGDLDPGERWYLGFTGFTTPSRGARAIGLDLEVSSLNAVAATAAAIEYWNGTTWVGVNAIELDDNGNAGYATSIHLGSANPKWKFVWPNDLATTTINSVTGYFFRFTILGNTLTAGTTVSTTNASIQYNGTASGSILRTGLIAAQFPARKKYIRFYRASNPTALWLNMGDMRNPYNATEETLEAIGDTLRIEEPPAFAVVPQFGECYVTYGNKVVRFKADPTSGESVKASVESDPTLVGPNAICDRDEVFQLGAFPSGRYITFFNSRLWMANLDGSPYEIRWSAPEPAYKVWPTLSNAVIMEDDNSPITGLRGFQENLVVFKSDSIWQMVNIGEDINGFDTFKARRMVRGTGCISNSSIQEVNGHLIFLAEDGIYAWMGGTEIKKLSDKISSTIKRINPSQKAFACAANWKSKSLYLLAVAVDGSEFNNLVIVWDYKNNTWWLWDNISAKGWCVDEDSSDKEQVMFIDDDDNVYVIGPGQVDNGTAITSYFTTHQIGSEDDYSKRLRRVELKSTNNSSSATVEVFRNDEPEGTSATFDYSDSTEASWSDFAYGEDSWTLQRDRLKAAGFLKPGEWFSATVTHSTKNTPFEMEHLKLAYMPVGRR